MPRYSRWLWVWILAVVVLLGLCQAFLFVENRILTGAAARALLVVLLVLLLVPIVLLLLIDSRRDFAMPRPDEDAWRRVVELEQELRQTRQEIEELRRYLDDPKRGEP